MTSIETIQSPSAARMVIDGRPILNFGGSCYLGLSAQPELAEAGVRAIEQLGSTGQLPRHYNFALAANLEAEEAARAFFGTGGAIYYATGYLFGLMAMSALAALYAYFTMRGPVRGVVLFCGSLIFAVLGNFARVFSVVLIAYFYRRVPQESPQ